MDDAAENADTHLNRSSAVCQPWQEHAVGKAQKQQCHGGGWRIAGGGALIEALLLP